jgi:hypothetical protein
MMRVPFKGHSHHLWLCLYVGYKYVVEKTILYSYILEIKFCRVNFMLVILA